MVQHRISMAPCEAATPKYTPLDVLKQLMKLKTKKSTAPGDLPSALVTEYAEFICVLLSHILNSCVGRGEYPRIWKVETQVPILSESCE